MDNASCSSMTTEHLISSNRIVSVASIDILRSKVNVDADVKLLPKWIRSIICCIDGNDVTVFYAENTLDYIKKKLNED